MPSRAQVIALGKKGYLGYELLLYAKNFNMHVTVQIRLIAEREEFVHLKVLLSAPEEQRLTTMAWISLGHYAIC